jgi:hypothetical protein
MTLPISITGTILKHLNSVCVGKLTYLHVHRFEMTILVYYGAGKKLARERERERQEQSSG